MTTLRDPLVAEALDRLFPSVDSDPEETLARARTTAERIRQSRTARARRAGLLAFALLTLLAGAAFAATRFDVLPWFDQSNRSSASFSIDSSRSYKRPAPETLACLGAGAGSFSCSRASFFAKGRRTYLFAERVEAPPRVSRQFYLDAVDLAERKGQISAATADRTRRDIAGAGDDFFSALAIMNVETIGGGEQAPGRPGYELVPPEGVPMWIACESVAPRFRCRGLASSRDVAVGTPLYFLRSSPDWVAVPSHAQRLPNISGFFRAAMGRDLRPAEVHLLIDLATTGRGSGSTRVRGSQSRARHRLNGLIPSWFAPLSAQRKDGLSIVRRRRPQRLWSRKPQGRRGT